MERAGALRIRTYGISGPVVVVLHGGPADVGGAAPLARGLADAFRVLEPWQRSSEGKKGVDEKIRAIKCLSENNFCFNIS